MKIYVYIDYYNNIVDWHKNIDDFKKKYDDKLCCPSPYYIRNTLGKKTILQNIREYGYCIMLYKQTFKQAGYLQQVLEGTDENKRGRS